MGIRRALCLLFFATKMAIETAIFTLLGKGFWGLWFCLGFFCWVFAVFSVLSGLVLFYWGEFQLQFLIGGMQKVKSEMGNSWL